MDRYGLRRRGPGAQQSECYEEHLPPAAVVWSRIVHRLLGEAAVGAARVRWSVPVARSCSRLPEAFPVIGRHGVAPRSALENTAELGNMPVVASPATAACTTVYSVGPESCPTPGGTTSSLLGPFVPFGVPVASCDDTSPFGRPSVGAVRALAPLLACLSTSPILRLKYRFGRECLLWRLLPYRLGAGVLRSCPGILTAFFDRSTRYPIRTGSVASVSGDRVTR